MSQTIPPTLATPALVLLASLAPGVPKTWSNAPAVPALVTMAGASTPMGLIPVYVSLDIREGIVMRSTFPVNHRHVIMMEGVRRLISSDTSVIVRLASYTVFFFNTFVIKFNI